MKEAWRVMLVDDHELVRHGIRALLELVDDVEVVAEAAGVRDAIATAELSRPDVILMDVRLRDGSGIEATREILARRPETRVLILTSYADDDAVLASVLAGASGYLLKQVRGVELVNAVRAVGEGVNLLDAVHTASVVDRVRRGKHLFSDERLARLSPQEERVLALVAKGRTNSQIASALSLAEKTVKNYVSSILGKLEVGRRAEAAAYVVAHSRGGEGALPTW